MYFLLFLYLYTMLASPQIRIPKIDLPSGFVAKTLQQEETGKKNPEGTPHRHNFFTVIWITRGSGVHQIDFTDFPVEDQFVHFVSPQQVHWFRAEPGIQGYLFLFTEEFLQACGINPRFLQALGLFTGCTQAEPLFIPPEKRTGLKELCLSAIEETDPSNDFYLEAAASYLRLFLIECSRIKGLTPNPVENRNENRILKSFLDNLDHHFHQKHKVAEYAGLMNITPNYLNEVVKEASGSSAKEHIQNRLALEAMRYATHSDMTTKETAFALGFEDPAHFSKFFKKMKGIDFTGFRDQIRKQHL